MIRARPSYLPTTLPHFVDFVNESVVSSYIVLQEEKSSAPPKTSTLSASSSSSSPLLHSDISDCLIHGEIFDSVNSAESDHGAMSEIQKNEQERLDLEFALSLSEKDQVSDSMPVEDSHVSEPVHVLSAPTADEVLRSEQERADLELALRFAENDRAFLEESARRDRRENLSTEGFHKVCLSAFEFNCLYYHTHTLHPLPHTSTHSRTLLSKGIVSTLGRSAKHNPLITSAHQHGHQRIITSTRRQHINSTSTQPARDVISSVAKPSTPHPKQRKFSLRR